MMTGVLVVAHGSRWSGANKQLEDTVLRLFEQIDCDQFAYAFLQFSPPSIEEQIFKMVKEGCKKIIILPYFLCGGRHLCCDIPEIIDRVRNTYDVEIKVAGYLGGHPKLVEIMLDRVKEVMNETSAGESKANRGNELVNFDFQNWRAQIYG